MPCGVLTDLAKPRDMKRTVITGVLGLIGIALAAIQCGAIGLSLTGVVITAGKARLILLLALMLGGLWWWAHARSRLPERLLTRSDRGPGYSILRAAEWCVIGLSVAVFIFLFYVSCVSRDLTCDGNAYHIPAIHFWMRHGGICWIKAGTMADVLLNSYPKGVETVAYVFAQAFDAGRPWNGISLLFVPLGVLGVAVLAMALGASRLASMTAGCAFLLVPVNIFQLQTFYVDTAFASCVIAMLTALSLICRPSGSRGEWIGKTALLGAMTGLTLSIKGTAAILVAVSYLVTLGIALLDGRHVGRDRWHQLWRVVCAMGLAMGLGLLVGGFWYFRNWAIEGNPLWPFAVSVGHTTVFRGMDLSQVIREVPPYGRMPEVLQVLWNWCQGGRLWPGSMRGVDSRHGGLGFIWAAGCLPAVAWAWWTLAARWRSSRATEGATREGEGAACDDVDVSRERRESLTVCLVSIASVTALVLVPFPWHVRYTIWICAAGLPCLGWWLTHAARVQSMKVVRGWQLGALLVLMGESLFAVFLLTRWDIWPGAWPERSVEILQPASWRWSRNYLFPETEGTAMDAVLQSSEPVAMGIMSSLSQDGRFKNNVLTTLCLPFGGRDVVGLPDPVTEANVSRLVRRGVRYVVLDDSRVVPSAFNPDQWRIEHVPGFWVLTRRDAASTPPNGGVTTSP